MLIWQVGNKHQTFSKGIPFGNKPYPYSETHQWETSRNHMLICLTHVSQIGTCQNWMKIPLWSICIRLLPSATRQHVATFPIAYRDSASLSGFSHFERVHEAKGCVWALHDGLKHWLIGCCNLSYILSGIVSDTLVSSYFWLSICHIYWHCIGHSIRREIWHTIYIFLTFYLTPN